MENRKSVYEFRIWFEKGPDVIQYRHVVAESSEEAEQKLIKYRDEMVSQGFSNFIYNDYPTVVVDCVID